MAILLSILESPVDADHLNNAIVTEHTPSTDPRMPTIILLAMRKLQYPGPRTESSHLTCKAPNM